MRLGKRLRIIAVIAMILSSSLARASGVFVSLTPALAAAEPGATMIATYLQSFSGVLSSLGGFGALARPLPLTSFDPTGPAGLQLTTLFTGTATSFAGRLASLTSGPGLSGLSDLATKLAGLSGPYGPVTLAVTGPGPGGVPTVVSATIGGKVVDDVQLAVRATRAVSAPLDFTQGSLALPGTTNNGSISTTLNLVTVLHFQYDPSVATAARAFSLLTSGPTPVVTLTVAADADLTPLVGTLGVTEINVAGHATMHIAAVAAFRDADADGQVTQDEWITTALAQLVSTRFVAHPAGDTTIALSLALPPSITSSSPVTGTVTVHATAADLAGGVMPTVTLGPLATFQNLTPDTLLSGVGKYAAALLVTQGARNARLPFTDNTLGATSGLGDRFATLLVQQEEAIVVCGTTDTAPPTGSVKNLPAGPTDVFCRATLPQDPTVVTWTLASGGAVVATSSALQTAGASPTQNVRLSLSSGGTPQVQLSFTLPDGSVHTAVPRIQSLQDLRDVLADKLGLSSPPAIVYDPATNSLAYTLNFTDTAPTATGALDVGSQISLTTGLTGLTSAHPGQPSIFISQPTFHVDLGLGVLLGAGIVDNDRFFVRPPTDAARHALTADAVITGAVQLNGRIGFVDVTAAGNPGADGAAFSITRTNPLIPLLAVDIVPPSGGIPVSTTTGIQTLAIPQAVGIGQLLQTLTTTVVPSCNMTLAAGLAVRAQLGAQADLGAGTVGVHWDPAFVPGSCTPQMSSLVVTTSQAFADTLGSFNLNPANPNELLTLILDNLDAAAGSLSTFPGLDQQIPIVGVRASALARKLGAIRNRITLLRTGGRTPGGVECDTTDGKKFAPADLSAAHLQKGDTVYCTARPFGVSPVAPSSPGLQLDPSLVTTTQVRWTASGATVTAHGTDPQTVVLTNTAGAFALAAAAAFTVTDPLGNFKATVQYTLATIAGTAAITLVVADYPAAAVPQSLQELATALPDALGVPTSALSISFGILSGDTHPDLVVRLGYGLCSPDVDRLDVAVHCATAATTAGDLATTYTINAGTLSLVGERGANNLALQYGAFAQLNTAIDLRSFNQSHPLDALKVLNTSRLSLAAGLNAANPRAIAATLGPLQAQVGGGVGDAAQVKVLYDITARMAAPLKPPLSA